MWIETEENELVNLDFYQKIEIFKERNAYVVLLSNDSKDGVKNVVVVNRKTEAEAKVVMEGIKSAMKDRLIGTKPSDFSGLIEAVTAR